MNEQTMKLIEAFAKMNAVDDADVVELAQRKVRTPEGVQKYDQPIGTIITKDMIEHAAKKAAQAASASLNKQVSNKTSSSSSAESASAPKASSTPPVNVPSVSPSSSVGKSTVPGGQTKTDLKSFYVSSYVNNPSNSSFGWVQKQDGNWYGQVYENGQIKEEKPLTQDQINALEVMKSKGFVVAADIPDATQDDDAKLLAKKIKDQLDSGKKASDPEVGEALDQLKGMATKQPSTEQSSDTESKSQDKTVEINGKQVKVGRYSRPKGFAKAFLIVQEDGQIFYEDKTGKRKKITAKSFENHQDLGMTKFLTEDTSAVPEGKKFQDGKLVDKDEASVQAPSPGKVESMKTPTSQPKSDPDEEKPAQEASKIVPGGESLKSEAASKIKFQGLLDKTKEEPASTSQQNTSSESKKEESEPGTVKIGGLTIKPGRYSRPKGFAKAFLIAHPDGTAEYEDKTGKRKKITGYAFKKNWELGMNKFLTSDTGPLKKGEHYEAGKLVGDSKKDGLSTKPSLPLDAAKKAAEALKIKQESAQNKEDEPEEETEFTLVSANGKTAPFKIPSGVKVYAANSFVNSGKSPVKVYAKYPNGDVYSMGVFSGKSKLDGLSKDGFDIDLADGYLKEYDLKSLKATSEKPKLLNVFVGNNPDSGVDVPEKTKVYVNFGLVDSDKANVAFLEFPDGKFYKLGVLTGLQPVDETAFTISYLKDKIEDGSLTLWNKYHKKDHEPNDLAKDFNIKIKGVDVTPVPEGSKVYVVTGSAPNTTPVKYVVLPGNKVVTVTGAGLGAIKDINESVQQSLKDGTLVDVTDMEKGNLAKAAPSVEPKTLADKEVAKSEKVEVKPSSVVGESVKISGMTIKPGKYSIGKSFAKAFLLVHPDGTAEYQNKSGQKKKLTAAAFKKNWDLGMNKYVGPLDNVPEGPSQSAQKPSPVTGLKKGKYYFKIFGEPLNHNDVGGVAEILDDGSFVLTNKNGTKSSFGPDTISEVTSSGFVMDEFGNSVFIPGSALKPKEVHLFGSENAVSIYDLPDIRDKMAGFGGIGDLTTLKEYTGNLSIPLLSAYAKKFFPNQPTALNKSVIKAIDDIFQSIGTTAAVEPEIEAVPNKTKGLFQVDSHGYAVIPKGISPIIPNTAWLSAGELLDVIKNIKDHFGDGKILNGSLANMNVYSRINWIQAFYSGKMKEMYEYEKLAGLSMDKDHPGSPENKDTHQIYWSPAIPGELPAGKIPDGEWSGEPDDMSSAEINNYLVKANMAYPAYLSTFEKKNWVKYHMVGDKVGVDSLSLQAKKNFSVDPNSVYSEAPKFDADVKPVKSYQKFLDKGYDAYSWSTAAKKDYVKDFPKSVPDSKKHMFPDYWDSDISQYLQNVKAEEAAKKHAEYLESLKPKFQKAAGFNVSGGHHEAMVLVDQFGKKWVYKPRDEENIFLADVEQGAHDLARLWGYKTSKSFITDFDGRKGHVQEMFDAESDLSSVSMSSLNSEQISDLAKEHLLDWALDNDDSWGANLLKLKNGSIVGIDKGRAYVNIGHWNGLSGDSSAHVHMPLVYTNLYSAIKEGSISQEDASAAYFSVIKQAKKMQKLSDDKMRPILESAFANRTNWSSTGGPSSKEAAIDAAIARKNSLVEDMEKLWDNVFNKSSYSKPKAPENIIQNSEDQDIHLGVTPEALKQAKDNGSYGASVFFSGPEVEDSHMVLYHAKSKTGVDMIHGEMKIRHDTAAYKDVETWLKNNAVKDPNTYSFTPSTMKPVLPNEEDYFQKIVAGVKTISTHALDGQYNAGALNGMSWVKNTLKNFVEDYDSKMSDPAGESSMIKQYKDPVAFKEMADKYLQYIAKAEQHKANGTKSTPGEFSQYVWTPPKDTSAPDVSTGDAVKVELRQASSAKTATTGTPKFDADGKLVHDAGYTEAGNPGSMYLVTLPTGETIEFRGDTTGTPAASKGLTRITFPSGDDDAASIERVRAQLSQMGLKLNDAKEDDLELFYWRHLAGIMKDRSDSKPGAYGQSPKFKKFNEDKPVETSKMTSSEEISAWRKAFANITSADQIDKFIADGGHLPKFGHYHLNDLSKSSGQPYWERFDVTDEDVFKKQMPSGAFYDDSHAEFVTMTGGMLSTEARLRILGMWKGGMSSSDDQGYGSSTFVFTRQNMEATDSSSDYSLQHIYYSPKIAKRTHNYSFGSDHYGNMSLKSNNSYFDFDSLTGFKDGSNELMIKHSVSMLDDIEIVTFTDSALRKKVIDSLKALGIDEIRGVPVEKRFVMRNKADVLAAQKAAKEAWKK